MASNSGSQGSLNVGAAPGFAPTSPGTLTLTSTTDGEIFFGNGIGLVNFNHTSDNYLFAPSITGAGSGSLIFNRSDNVTFDLIYSKKAVTLEFLNLITPVPPVGPIPPPVVITTIDFASFAQIPNQRAAASLLDGAQLNPRASNLMSFLYKEPFANLPSDFARISPESLTAFYEISFSGANIQRLSLENRLEHIRNSSIGANGTG